LYTRGSLNRTICSERRGRKAETGQIGHPEASQFSGEIGDRKDISKTGGIIMFDKIGRFHWHLAVICFSVAGFAAILAISGCGGGGGGGAAPASNLPVINSVQVFNANDLTTPADIFNLTGTIPPRISVG
jgi:hypothetical protein